MSSRQKRRNTTVCRCCEAKERRGRGRIDLPLPLRGREVGGRGGRAIEGSRANLHCESALPADRPRLRGDASAPASRIGRPRRTRRSVRGWHAPLRAGICADSAGRAPARRRSASCRSTCAATRCWCCWRRRSGGAVAPGARPRPVLRRRARRRLAGGAQLGRGGAAAAPRPRAGRSVWRADHAGAAGAGGGAGVAAGYAGGFCGDPGADDAASPHGWECRSGARR